MQPYARYALWLGIDEPVELLAGEQLVSLSVRQRVELVERTGAPRAMRWAVRGREYMYELRDAETGKEVVAFHWQPRAGRRAAEPHLHARQEPTLLGRAHIPSPCMTVHRFMRFLLTELRIEPIEPRWESVLDEVERRAQAIEEQGVETWRCEHSDR